jgi:hypothetical protein
VIWADPAGNDQQNRLPAKPTVTSAGKLSASLRLTRSVTLVAKFAGDAGYLPR